MGANAKPAHIRGNDITVERHGFQRHNAKRLVDTGENGDIHHLIEPITLLVGNVVEEADRIINSQL